MDAATVKSNERRFFEYVNLRDTESMGHWVDNFVTKDFINHNPILGVPNNRDGLKEMFSLLFNVFPEISFTIKEIIFENDILCFRHIVHGIKENEEITGIAMASNHMPDVNWIFAGVKPSP